MKKRKIFIDFHYLKNMNKGFGQYSYHLSKALSKSVSELEYIFYIPKKKYLRLLFNKKNIIVNYYYSFHRQLGIFGRNFIFHSTNQLSKIEPINKKVPYILTIHDINFIYDEIIDKKVKQRIQKKINRANAIVYVSHFTKKEVNKHFKIASSKLQKVIYNGNSLINSKVTFKDKLLDFKYLFSITEMRPYKNLDKLILMMNYIPKEYKLILAGKGSDEYLIYLKKLIKENNLEEQIILKGIVSEEEKINLFGNCHAFVFPSSREGFGLPVVEALNFDKPIFLYNRTSLPEIGGEASFYWENLDSKLMATALLQNLEYFKTNKEEMLKKINKQLAKFDWNFAAKQYEDVYKCFLTPEK